MKKNNLNILIYLLIILIIIYIIKTLKILGICCLILSILSPLLFGYVISWILKPIINKITNNKVLIGIIYIAFISIIFLLIIKVLPVFIKSIKKVIPSISYYIYHNKYLYKIYNIINIKKIITLNIKYMNNCLNNIFSLIINVIYSIIFGFYFLINNINYFKFIPNKLKKNISKDLRLYLKSILLDTLFMFITLSIVFLIEGIEYPIVFALFCAITNIIPYIGPYIGGIPAILVGLSSSYKLGIIVLVTIIIVQLVENTLIQPIIVSKNVNINPIYILISIILFSYFFSVVGMVIATPILIIIINIIKFYKKNKPKWFNQILDKL